MRLHPLQDRVEVVWVDFNELSLLQLGERLFRISGEISEHADDEGQFLDFDCPSNFDIIGDLHPGRTHPVKLMLRTLLSHRSYPQSDCVQTHWIVTPLRADFPLKQV